MKSSVGLVRLPGSLVGQTGAGRRQLASIVRSGGGSIVIAGGGVIGSSVAYFLAEALRERGQRLKQGEGAWRVTVVEKDPAYRFSSSTLSASSIRHQFSTPENVKIGQYLLPSLPPR